MRKYLKCFSLILVFTFLFSNVSFALNEKNDSKTKVNKEQKEALKKIRENRKDAYKILKEVEKFVVRNDDGTFSIKGNPKVGKEELKSIQVGMSQINDFIKQGLAESDVNLRVYWKDESVKGNTVKNKDQYISYDEFFIEPEENKKVSFDIGNKTVNIKFANVAYADSYRPPVGYYTYWWGWRLSLDEYTTQKIAKASNVGAAATAISAACGSVPLVVISGVFWLGSAVIDYVDYDGGNKGVYIDNNVLMPCPALQMTVLPRY